MSWQVLILLQTVLTGASTISLRILARNKQTAKASFVINAAVFVVLYITFLALLPLLGPVHGNTVLTYWWRFLGGGLAFALSNICSYKTLVYFDAAISSIAGTLNVLFTVIGASLVLGEYLKPIQVVGALVLLAAISYAVLSTRHASRKSGHTLIKMGLLYTLLAGVTYCVAIVNEKSLLGHMTVATYAVYGVGGQTLVSMVVAAIIQPKKLRLLFELRNAGWSVLSGIMRGLSGACFILAEIHSNNVALVTTISNFKLIVVVLLGWWLLKEHHKLAQKLESAVAAIIGLSFMSWR